MCSYCNSGFAKVGVFRSSSSFVMLDDVVIVSSSVRLMSKTKKTESSELIFNSNK